MIYCPLCRAANKDTARFCQKCSTPLPRPTPPAGPPGSLPAGAVLDNHYQIIRLLGKGGQAAVYLASDRRLGAWQVAVKEISDATLTDPSEKREAITNFEQEACLLAQLKHPNLPRVFNYFQEGGNYYLVMDFVEGRTLKELLDDSQTPFPQRQVLAWADQLCDVLAYLHGRTQPIIFRDLNPRNIMVEPDGLLKLIDFGIARLFKPGQSKDTAKYGTVGYAPPEQYGQGQTDVRSDLFALGATLHHLLTLRDPADEPFKFPAVSSLNSRVSPTVNQAIMKAVEYDRTKRWPDVASLRRALQPAPPRWPLYTVLALLLITAVFAACLLLSVLLWYFGDPISQALGISW
jgi:serine/threonine-protein kinase